jgi:hypothetical protein
LLQGSGDKRREPILDGSGNGDPIDDLLRARQRHRQQTEKSQDYTTRHLQPPG